MSNQYDVVIIGAGIVGLAIGERLAADGIGRVAIFEKEPLPGMGATARSAGGIRQQFSDPHKIRAARFGYSFYHSFQARYGVDPEFKMHGYLIVRSDPRGAEHLKAGVKLQQDLGLDTSYLEPKNVSDLFPALNTTDLLAASFNGSDGYLDPHAVVQGFRRSFDHAGGELACDEKVVSLAIDDHRILGVRSEKRTVHAGATVLAPGPHVKDLLGSIGIDLPLRTCRRQIFATGPVAGIDPKWPLILDEDAPFYFRPEGDGVIMSLAEVEDFVPPAEGHEIPVDRAGLPELAARASHRCPLLSDATIQNAWAGLRTLTPDERPMLGPVPGWEQGYLAAGFSGHGITLAPFAAERIAREITGQSLEADWREPFLPDRFLEI